MNLNLSKNEALILKLLLAERGAEIYGWDLIEKSEGALKRGTIYVTLNRMEEKGYVTSRKEQAREGERGRPRRFYRITGLGQKTFGVWEMARMGGVLI